MWAAKNKQGGENLVERIWWEKNSWAIIVDTTISVVVVDTTISVAAEGVGSVWRKKGRGAVGLMGDSRILVVGRKLWDSIEWVKGYGVEFEKSEKESGTWAKDDGWLGRMATLYAMSLLARGTFHKSPSYLANLRKWK
ncbi:hypothetical protein ACLOJK_004517 [Asimina triloba]